MKKQQPEESTQSFTPDSELLALATKFSENYLSLDAGEYFSENKMYQINYIDVIKDISGIPLSTGARVSNYTGIIELDKSILKSNSYSSDFVFYIILWCISCYQQGHESDSRESLADIETLKYYLTTGRSKNSLIKGLAELFLNAPSQLNIDRMEAIKNQIKNHEH